ncbi:MAG: TadE/TadG family type IV pilus assembly protein [bacterium]
MRRRGGRRFGAAVRRSRRAESGQSTLEFALVLPFFLLLFLAMIEFGIAWTASSAAAAAAKEGAEYARRQVPFSPAVLTRANEIAARYLEPFTRAGGFAVASIRSGELVGEDTLTVEVDVQYPLLTGAFLRSIRFGAEPVFGDGTITIRREARVLIL